MGPLIGATAAALYHRYVLRGEAAKALLSARGPPVQTGPGCVHGGGERVAGDRMGQAGWRRRRVAGGGSKGARGKPVAGARAGGAGVRSEDTCAAPHMFDEMPKIKYTYRDQK